MKRVVVVDSGVNYNSTLEGIKILKCIKVTSKNDAFCFEEVMLNDVSDEVGHGTSVVSILHRYAPDVEFIIVKAFYNENEINSNVLINILQYINDNIECDLINMSCGCTRVENVYEMEKICNALTSKGVVIIAAFSNEGEISYPASLENVIGVDYSLSCFSPKEYYYIENSNVNIRGVGYPQKLPIREGEYKLQSGSSFVVPHIAGMILKQKEKINCRIAKEILKAGAKEIINFNLNSIETPLFNINKAAIFPYSKETDVLLRFQHLLNFEIDSVLCTKYQLPLISEKYTELNKDCNIPIRTIDKYCWENEDVDTIIIGHVNMLSKASKVNLKRLLIEKCIRYKKNLYLFDSIDNDEVLLKRLLEQGNHVYIPSINAYKNNNYGKLFVFNSPIIGVFGTGPKQGKFSLQLMLRDFLTSIGYTVANFGTEPTAKLFNLEASYPCGYNSSVNISGEDAISYVNKEIAKIDHSNPDLIIVGSQSQTIQTSEGNIGFYNYNQYEIILGAQPDAYFLCVCINDDINYILRTIHFLEAINESKVIGIILFPYVYENNNGILTDKRIKVNDEEVQLFIESLNEKTSKKVISFLSPDIKEILLSCIQERFS